MATKSRTCLPVGRVTKEGANEERLLMSQNTFCFESFFVPSRLRGQLRFIYFYNMRHKIKTFGIARDIMGGREVTVETTGNTVGDLRQELVKAYPQLRDLNSLFIAVNLNYADDNAVLTPNDEIALIPPVSGG